MNRFLDWWHARSKKAQIALATGAVLALVVLATALVSTTSGNKKTEANQPPPPSTPKGDVDKHTRDYVNQVKACRLSVGWAIRDVQRGNTSAVEIAEETTNARVLCNTIRSRLLTMNTGHFDDPAKTAWHGVVSYKSALDALLAFGENPDAAGKLIEAIVKLQEGERQVAKGLKEINARRRVYDLRPIPLGG